jgi:hypothetical protein
MEMLRNITYDGTKLERSFQRDVGRDYADKHACSEIVYGYLVLSLYLV